MQYVNESLQLHFMGSVCSTSKIFSLKKIGHCLLSLQSRRAFQDRIGVWPQDESDYFHFCDFEENMQTLAHVVGYFLLAGLLGGWKCIVSLWGQFRHFSSLPGNGKGPRWWEHRVIWTSELGVHRKMVRTLRLIYKSLWLCPKYECYPWWASLTQSRTAFEQARCSVGRESKSFASIQGSYALTCRLDA